MRRLGLLAAFCALLCVPASAVEAETIEVSVKGMVCSFCAQGIAKNVSKLPGVVEVAPDLDKHLVIVVTERDAQLTDDQLRSALEDSGYTVDKVERRP